MLVKLVGTLSFVLTLIGHPSLNSHGYSHHGLAMAMPLVQIGGQSGFGGPLVITKVDGRDDHSLIQQKSMAGKHHLNDRKSSVRQKSTSSRKSTKDENNNSNRNIKKRRKKHRHEEGKSQGQREGQDVYQDKFLDFASRATGKSRKQAKEIVDRENKENDNGQEWIKEYEERDAREQRRISVQEKKDKEFGMFAYYIGKSKARHQHYQNIDHHHHDRQYKGHDHDHDHDHQHKNQIHQNLDREFQGNLILKSSLHTQQQTKSNSVAIEKNKSIDQKEETDSTIVKYAWVVDKNQDKDKDKNNVKNLDAIRIGSTQYKQVPKSTPAIFYVPHQDDDALAMALSIREHVESGRKVIVHLYSDGVNPLLRDIVAGDAPCTLQHNPTHRQNLTLEDVVTGRTHEFRNSLRALGVKDEDIFETGWSDVEPFLEYDSFKAKLHNLIVGYENKYPGASHKCISGEYDTDSTGRNPTHRACWDVATQLVSKHPHGWPSSKQLWDFRFFRTYTFYNSKPNRTAQFTRSLPQYLHYKQRALDQYKRWDPESGELAWGYHSVKTLIDASYSDPLLYIDMLDIDPVNPENRDKDRYPKENAKQDNDTRLQSSGVKTNDQKATVETEKALVEQVILGDSVNHHGWSEKEIHAQKEFLDSYQEAVKRPEGRGYQVGQDIKIKINLGL